MDYVTLNNGLEMPILGFGVFKMDDTEAEQSVAEALAVGYRAIDTAASYQNEEAVGHAIKKSGVPREDIFVTSKLTVKDISYERTKQAYQTSLAKLGLDYLDLYIIHQPYGDIFGAWKAMVELYEEGKIKAIGVSNFSSAKLTNFILSNRQILGIETIPMVNQIETHPFYQEREAREIMDEYAVTHEGWAPFAEGNYDIFSNEVLAEIAERHSKTIAQVVMRWHVQKGIVAIPKSTHKERIIENFAIFDFGLTEEDMNKIATLDTGKSLFDHEDPAFVKRLFARFA